MVTLSFDASTLFGLSCTGLVLAFIPLLVVRGLRVVLRIFGSGSDWKLPE